MEPLALNSFILLLFVGLASGWLSGLVTQGGGFGIPVNIAIGTGGAFFGFYILRAANAGTPSSLLGAIAAATSGALLLLFLVGLLRR
jgi:uncharacterized membrane protein YeaQ/YmgE (transglycosylase-associated protein family)